MKHPYQRFAQIQLFLMVITIILGAFAIFNGNAVLVLLTFFTLSLSFVFEGLVEWKKDNTLQLAQQLVRAIVIIVCASYLFF